MDDSGEGRNPEGTVYDLRGLYDDTGDGFQFLIFAGTGSTGTRWILSGVALSTRKRPGAWIPAFAGMTWGGVDMDTPRLPTIDK